MDIISLPVELDKKRFDSRFRLVNLAVQIARNISSEQIELPKGKKLVTYAIERALAEDVHFLTGEEALKAFENDRKKAQESKKVSLLIDASDDIAKEVRRDLDSYLKTSSTIADAEKESVESKPALSSVDALDELET